MTNYCTLFDSNYLLYGLETYYSLARQSSGFHLYIFPFDDKCYKVLSELNLPSVTLVAQREFEDEVLLRVKKTRSVGEYCWTCSPSIILYCIEKFSLDHCIYIDADLYFYSNPAVLVDEWAGDSVLIAPHRYTPEYAYLSEYTGIYCVQFTGFRNDVAGMRALRWWRDACIEWCFARIEDGKFGDQKYLDDWPARFEGVHELQHLGGGVAAWNIQQYEIIQGPDGRLTGLERATGQKFELVFFHFHGLKFPSASQVDLGNFKLTQANRELVYKPYLKRIQAAKAAMVAKGYSAGLSVAAPISFVKKCYRFVKRSIKGIYNVHNINDLT